MIEDAIFLVLGVSLATLIALASVPLIWRRALVEARRRLELVVPLSVQEIAAGRDLIRAEAAVSQRKLEQRLEARDRAMADLTVELGRRTVSLAQSDAMNTELRRERAVLIVEAADASRSIVELEAQRAAANQALHDGDIRLDTLTDAHRTLGAERERVAAGLTAEQVRAARLDDENDDLRARIADRQKESESIRAVLAELRLAHTTVTRERNEAHLQTLVAEAESHRLQDELLQERHRHAAFQSRANLLVASEIGRMTSDEGSARPATLTSLKQRLETLQATLLETEASGNVTDHPLAESLAALRREIAAVGDEALLVLGDGSVEPSLGVPEMQVRSGAR